MKLRLIFATAALLIGVACSGATETGLFGPSGTADGTTPSSSGDDSSGGTEDSPPSSSSSSSSSSGKSSSSSSSSSGGPKKDGGTTKDSGPPPPQGTPIFCGEKKGNATTCSSATQVCCGSFQGPGDPSFECKPKSSACSGGATRISCDDRTDCPSDQICCGLLVDAVGYSSIECRSSCTSVPGVLAVHFCDPNAAYDECLDYDGICVPSQSVPGFYVCGPQ